ncbi:ROK family protein [Streptococcus hyointestinalis]|uniref:Transcriptional regulator n=1 Tax=Streptococcus hyointestinalis TaxID=1337 RepID=A0A380KCN8_9STRE|nr:ROK family protein [Streptococcus hyointestinalis]SUN61906.1 transcriptional regulator [Streptococcus hyointestinalis]
MILAFDLGGTEIKSALINDNSEIEENFAPFSSPDNLESLFDIMDKLINHSLDKIQGIAISCPGKVDTKCGIIYFGGMLTFLHECPIKNILESRYGLPVAVINDAKAAVLAEMTTGYLQGIDNGLAMVLGSGLGGGIVINGKLYQGSHYQAGELSFLLPFLSEKMTIEDFLGMKFSAVSMISDCSEALGLKDKKNGYLIFDHIVKKDERVYPIFQKYCRLLAIYITNLQSILDVERIVIGGGISSQDILIEEIEKQLDQLQKEEDVAFFNIERPKIVACKHKNDANLIGAACSFKI